MTILLMDISFLNILWLLGDKIPIYAAPNPLTTRSWDSHKCDEECERAIRDTWKISVLRSHRIVFVCYLTANGQTKARQPFCLYAGLPHTRADDGTVTERVTPAFQTIYRNDTLYRGTPHCSVLYHDKTLGDFLAWFKVNSKPDFGLKLF